MVSANGSARLAFAAVCVLFFQINGPEKELKLKTKCNKSSHQWQTKCPCGPFLISGKYVEVHAGCFCGATL